MGVILHWIRVGDLHDHKHSITQNENSSFCPYILQSDWLRALKQGSK